MCFSVAGPDGARLTRSVQLPGGRADVRDRSTTVAMHLVRRLLRGEHGDRRRRVSARLFVALDLPAPCASALGAFGRGGGGRRLALRPWATTRCT